MFPSLSSPPIDVIDVHVKSLRKLGYNNLEEWNKDPNHLYVGRYMPRIKGTSKSKWGNPFALKSYGDRSILLYEEYARSGPLWEDLHQLSGKTLGCWCDQSRGHLIPETCHARVLVRLFKEKYPIRLYIGTGKNINK